MEGMTIVYKDRVVCAICLGRQVIYTAGGGTRPCLCRKRPEEEAL